MQPFVRLVLVTVMVGLVSCSTRPSRTIITGRFASPEEAPAEINLFHGETGEEFVIPVENGEFSYAVDRDKTTVYDLSFEYPNGDEWYQTLIPDADTIRYEMDGGQTEVFYTPANSLNEKHRAYRERMMEAFSITDSVEGVKRMAELKAYANRLVEEEPDNFVGCDAFTFVSFELDEQEWFELYQKLSPEIQAKPYIQQRIAEFESKRKTAVGAMFIDYAATRADGSAVRLSDYVGRGKYVLVDYWASWCGACVLEMPYIRAAYDRYHGDRFDVLGVAIDDNPQHVQTLMDEQQIRWDIIYSCDTAAMKPYGVQYLPKAFLFGPDGTILVRDGLCGEAVIDTLARYLEQ